ncbi:ATPase n2b, putative [Perkinsus marinus ATCC 50983]|uniref:ATPase n2b, putative n=1 Tax=Perkinsus marinus (strain ATCC 50983 / TXsc) TaxID=423536 RepID=C5LZE0_PERM5|nr:ATPase n2b, putative [Perkinsus marinus ATCC 50983]EEQ97934.1 ATPase n2b, putative [Perkinsus marinus ATCC 50983]|eukprot:XP_002765217.1 ATPase n2b, putative [Perkinsus marinus ATCC 50983]
MLLTHGKFAGVYIPGWSTLTDALDSAIGSTSRYHIKKESFTPLLRLNTNHISGNSRECDECDGKSGALMSLEGGGQTKHTTIQQRAEDTTSTDTCELSPDEKQDMIVVKLDELAQRLERYSPCHNSLTLEETVATSDQNGGPSTDSLNETTKNGGGFFTRFFGASSTTVSPFVAPPVGCKGLYLWGGCGSGKSMLMDLFFQHVSVQAKKRVHFHEWMMQVHSRLHEFQLRSSSRMAKLNGHENDLIDQVADEMMREAWLLCFDEFQVTFISDAVIMRRLFSKLFERGCVVVATSNRPPEDLYKNGLNRGLFLPFIPMLKRFTEVIQLDSDIDYRYIMAQAANGGDERSVYLSPLTDFNRRLLEAKFYKMAKNEVNTHQKLEIQGRHLDVRRAARHTALAWFTFKELCDRPLGAADYLAIGKHYHTIFVEDIPVLTIHERDQVRRFITLIDGLYEAGTKLVCSAEAEPGKHYHTIFVEDIPVLTIHERDQNARGQVEQMHQHSSGALFRISDEDKSSSAFDEVFAWDRTVSRLMELFRQMQSGEYLSEHARKLSADEMLGQYELNNLSKEDVDDLWFRYDRDDSGSIDVSELTLLLEDLTEHVEGHRNVPAEVVIASMDFLDLDKNGVIDRNEFEQYCQKYGLAFAGHITVVNAEA